MTTLNLKNTMVFFYNCQTLIIWCVYISQPTKTVNNVQFEENKEQRRFNEIKVKLTNEHGWSKVKDYIKTRMRRSYIRA